MARPREFDPDVALSGATDIFWRQGYKATNLPDLLVAMGLTRGSFYKAFRDKLSAYLAALDHYDRTLLTQTADRLEACDASDAWGCLSLLFQGGGDDRRGCFICNAMVEMGAENADVAARTEAMSARMRDAIQSVLTRYGVGVAQDRWEMADLILHLYYGHQAMGKAVPSVADWPVRLEKALSPNTSPEQAHK